MDLFFRRLVKRAVGSLGYEIVRQAPREPSPFPADALPEDREILAAVAPSR